MITFPPKEPRMCQRCVDVIAKYWPDLPKEQWSDLLWGATAFPAGDHELIEQQVKEMAERTNCDLQMALAIADTEMDAAMRELRKNDRAEGAEKVKALALQSGWKCLGIEEREDPEISGLICAVVSITRDGTVEEIFAAYQELTKKFVAETNPEQRMNVALDVRVE